MSVTTHPRARGGSARGRQVSARRVRDLVLASIRDGSLELDAALVEEDLMAMFSASRGAVRAALTSLSEAGFLVRRPRFGTRVHRTELGLAVDDFATGGHHVEIGVTEQRLVPGFPLVRARLGIDDDHVRLVENTFAADGELIGLRNAYFSTTYETDARDFVGAPITMEEIAEQFFFTARGGATISIGAEAADDRTARLLGVSAGDALLIREIVYTAADGRPYQLVFDRFRADRVRFETCAA